MYFKKGKAKIEIALGKENFDKRQTKPEIGIVIRQDISENLVKCVYLSLGSNLGDRRKNIEDAKHLLINNKIFIENTSSYYKHLHGQIKIFQNSIIF